jgi:hypothetical protein
MLLPEGVFYYRASDLEHAETLLRKGLDACAYFGLGSNVLLGHYYLGRVLLAKGNFEADKLGCVVESVRYYNHGGALLVRPGSAYVRECSFVATPVR